nr:staphylococcal nuclease domain-containing protein 1-like [Ipomoea trifida]
MADLKLLEEGYYHLVSNLLYSEKEPGDQIKVASIQKQLASLNLQEAPVIGAFNPKKGDIVLAQFSADNSWNRAMNVNFVTFSPCLALCTSICEHFILPSSVPCISFAVQVAGEAGVMSHIGYWLLTNDDRYCNMQEGLARQEKRWIPKPVLEELEKSQTEAREKRRGMWEYGDIESDDEESAPPLRKAATGKR